LVGWCTAVSGALLHRHRHEAKAQPAVCIEHETSTADGHFEQPGHISDSTELDQAPFCVVSTTLVLRSYDVRQVTEHYLSKGEMQVKIYGFCGAVVKDIKG